MLIGRLIGRLLLLAGLAVAAWDGLNWLETDRFRFITGGEIWFTLDVDSLNGAQAAIQRYGCLLYTSPSPRDDISSRMPSSA